MQASYEKTQVKKVMLNQRSYKSILDQHTDILIYSGANQTAEQPPETASVVDKACGEISGPASAQPPSSKT